MSTLYVIASHVQYANEEIGRIKPLLSSNDKIIPVFKDADMRGYAVLAEDQVVVVGTWDMRPTHEVKWLVDIFNSRRVDVDALALMYRPGEAPTVIRPKDGLRQDGFTYVNYAPSPSTTTSLPTWTSTSPSASAAPDSAKRLADAEKSLKDALAAKDRALQMVAQLSEWMLNVLPVEDADIPGVYWCGICQKRTTNHEDDCPQVPR